MAGEKEYEADDEASEVEASELEAGGKKKIIIIALIALLVIGGGGGAAMMFMGGDGSGAELAEGETAGASAAVIVDADPIYVPLDPAFVVNFQDKNNHTKFLKAELNVVTFDEDVGEAITKHMPAIRNNLILLFSRQLYEDLVPHEGKELLRAEALAQVQTVIEKQTGRVGVQDLFFTNFVIQ